MIAIGLVGAALLIVGGLYWGATGSGFALVAAGGLLGLAAVVALKRDSPRRE